MVVEQIDHILPVTNTKIESEISEKIILENPLEENKSEIPETPKENIAKNAIKEVDKPIKININSPQNRVSGLSLSSLKLKKEHQLSKKETAVDESKLPKSPFTEDDMQKHWADFVHQIDSDGRKILASNLNTDIPKLKDETTIWIELPNDTMKKEIEREQFDLLEYLRAKLDNYFIKLKITVNEATAKKFAFTPEEKYEKLREKNPAIDILRREFDLDL